MMREFKGTFVALPKIQDQVRHLALFCAGLLVLGTGVVAQEERKHPWWWDVFGLCAPRITARLSGKKNKKKRDMLARSANQRAALFKLHSNWNRRL